MGSTLRQPATAAAGRLTFAEITVLPDSSLLRLPNATLTPHIAGASQQTIDRPTAMIAEEIHRYVAGERPLRSNCDRETN